METQTAAPAVAIGTPVEVDNIARELKKLWQDGGEVMTRASLINLALYSEALDCRIERRQDSIGLVQLRAGSSLIDLVPVDGKLGRAGGAAPGPGGRNMDHFCVRVEPFDEAAIRSQLAKYGYLAGPLERRYGAEGEGSSIYVTDPEGNVVELKGPPGG